MLSRYRWLIDGTEPLPVALSNVEQHLWVGYYIRLPRDFSGDQQGTGSGEMATVSEKSLELQLTRSVAYGVHEDVDITNFTQESTSSCLQLELDADFIDQQEAVHQRKQFGQLSKSWQRNQKGSWELLFDYEAQHHFEHQGDKGDCNIRRSIAIEIANCGSEPSYSDNLITFQVHLNPLESWHACVRMNPHVDNEPTFPLYDCYAIQDETTTYEVNRQLFLDETTRFASPTTGTLANAVVETLEQAKHDLAALRLHDLDHDSDAWVPAAGIPIFVALFGRDTLTVSWEAAIVGNQMMRRPAPDGQITGKGG